MERHVSRARKLLLTDTMAFQSRFLSSIVKYLHHLRESSNGKILVFFEDPAKNP